MLLLVISLLALAVAPLVDRVAESARQTLSLLDGFVMVAISGLVLVHIIPHAVAAAGPWALALACIGFIGPGLVERSLHNAAARAHTATLILALAGLVVHEFFDGVALGAPGGDQGHESGASVLAIAVALHRLPVAITVWWLLRPIAGRLVAGGTLVALGVATLAGYGFAGVVEAHIDATWLGLFQALVAGSLLHVVIHRPAPLAAPSSAGRGRLYAGIGALLGVAVVALLADTHLPFQPESGAIDFTQTFTTLVLESAPALMLAFALAGLVQVFLPPASLRWMRTGRPLTESVRGVAFGLPLPICSCGVIPLYRTLIVQGAPATAAMAFLVATPELGLDAILISLPLLGSHMTIARIVAAAIVAILVGWVVGRLATSTGEGQPALDAAAQVRGSILVRMRAGLTYGFGEIVDHIGPWLLLGLVIASLAEPLISGDWIVMLPFGLDVVIFALLGMPMYVCASGATPLVAVLLHKGVSPGAALAFLLSGPATNITTFGVLRDLHGRRIAVVFACAIAGLSIALGIALNFVLTEPTGLQLHVAVHEDPTMLAMLSLGALATVFMLSILRQGPRGFVGQVLAPYGDDDDHEHHHSHGHEHGHEH